jgi:hypothetical protein
MATPGGVYRFDFSGAVVYLRRYIMMEWTIWIAVGLGVVAAVALILWLLWCAVINALNAWHSHF